MTNVLLADDHPVIRSALTVYINKVVSPTHIDEAWETATAFEKIKQNNYSLIILDATIAGEDSFQLVGNTIAVKPNANILMFSVNNEEVYAKKYLQLGAKGYLSKDAPEEEIINAIKNVFNNKLYISASLMEAITDDASGHKKDNPFNDLSHREFEIAKHLINGESVSEISTKLNLHTSTVGTNKSRIFEKLNCKNVIDLNALAKKYKVI